MITRTHKPSQHRAATVRERTAADTRDVGPLPYGRGSVLGGMRLPRSGLRAQGKQAT